MSDTSTTQSAREHARAQAGEKAKFQRAIPVIDPELTPENVIAEDMIWSEILGAGNYAAQVLPQGARLKLTDLDGDTCVQLLVFNARQSSERINVADTVKIQWQAYFGKGQLLLSDLGRVLMTAVDDTSVGHDSFNAMSNLPWNKHKYGSGAVHGYAPNARDLFSVVLTKHGLERRDICPCINLFKKIVVEPDGTFAWHGDESLAGGQLTLRCETDLLVAMTNTPHVLDPRTTYTSSPVKIEAWKGPITKKDDEFRNATPEALRAFENIEYYNHTAIQND